MAKVEDVAAYVLERQKSATTWELQKLVYYANGWAWAWDGEPLIDGPFGAWPKGPVSKSLFAMHVRRHRLIAGEIPAGDPNRLTASQKETIDAVLDFYGALGAEELVELSHRERPWREARGGIGPTEKSDTDLSDETIRAYFGKLARGSREKRIPDDVRTGVRLALSVPEDEIEELDDVTEGLSGADADRFLSDMCNDAC